MTDPMILHVPFHRQLMQMNWMMARSLTNLCRTACMSLNTVVLNRIQPLEDECGDVQQIKCSFFCSLTRFDVFPKNGTIYVKNGALLDREITSSYTATLQAVDSAGKIGTTVLEINLRDINDQKPVMNRDVYEAFVQENQNLKLLIQVRKRLRCLQKHTIGAFPLQICAKLVNID